MNDPDITKNKFVLLRQFSLATQYVLGIIVFGFALMLWFGWIDFKYTAHFLALLSLLTGSVILNSCTAPGRISLKQFLNVAGVAGWLAGMCSALVFWEVLPIEIWYYLNLVLILGIGLSLFTETEKGRKIRSVFHVVASIIILITLSLLMLHVTGLVDLKLPLIILTGAIFVLLLIVLFKNKKDHIL